MNWSDERYVRVYTRDTADWMAMSFDAQALLVLLIRKLDRSGVLELGRHGKKAVAIAIGHAAAWPRLEPALEELLADGCVVINGDTLVMRNFVEAQEVKQTDRMRQAESRARRRSSALHPGAQNVTNRDTASRFVTESHTPSHAVTDSHTESQSVTPCLAVLSRAEPCRASNTCSAELSGVQTAPRWTPDLDAVYAAFPRKEGKSRGLSIARKQIRTPADFEDLQKAVTNYARMCLGKEKQFVKQFSTFMACWRDYLDADVVAEASPIAGGSTLPIGSRRRDNVTADDLFRMAEDLRLRREGA